MCVVMVFDGDFIDIVLLVIIINDVNDYMFRFISVIFMFYVQLNIGVGIVFGFIMVFDNDVGVFGWFIFRKFLVLLLCDKLYFNFFVLSVIILFVFIINKIVL